GRFESPYEPRLFTFTPAPGPHINIITVTDDAPQASPGLFLLPKSGKFVDNFGAPTSTRWLGTSSTDPFYAILWELDGRAPFNYAVTRSERVATQVAEAREPANDRASAVAIPSLPAVILGASLENAADQDWFSIQVSQVGQRIRVVTHAGDPKTDTVVTIYAADGITEEGTVF